MEARARSLCQLLNKVPCKLNLYGRKWEKGDTGAILGPYQRGWVYGDGYAKALCGAKIGLCFLNREVGDLYTTRTFEIPACGVFMLAERTDLHKELFAEDREAAYFDSDEELVDKVRFYLSHEVMRRRIAEAGYHKVKEYTWKARMRECVAVLKDIN
jgi:glycosyltransferase involved in cell wall biosynthesis